MSIDPLILAFLGGAVSAFVVRLLVVNLTRSETPVEHGMPAEHAVESAPFARALNALLGPPILDGNRVEVLENGVEIFPAMLEAIRGAERTINFESYVYWRGEIADRFAESIAERARAGVEVKVLLDWVGSTKMKPELIALMRDAGAEVKRYRPPRWHLLERFNRRTHRKLLIADGRVGFTGGVGIADEWTGDAQDPEHWRDLHFRVTGPVVAQLQAGFLNNWVETDQEVLLGDDYFPPLEPAGPMKAQNMISSPDEGSQSVHLLFLLAIAGARRSLRIITPYFVPDELTVKTICEAAERGVKVELLVPGQYTDTKTARWASKICWGRLFEAGVIIWEYEPTMLHSKAMMVDGVFATVGSTNFDNRSFRLNDESNLTVFDREFVAELDRVFEKDVETSRQATYEEWRRRPLFEKVRDRVSALLGPQL